MSKQLRGLLTDLHIRVDKMTRDLIPRSMQNPIASNFKKDTVERLNAIRGEILHELNGGLLDDPFYRRNVVVDYRTLSDKLLGIELARYLPLVNYRDAADGFLQTLLNRIYKEIASVRPPSFISTISNSESYYWADLQNDKIALPYGEERNLLNMSDLYHEIAHFQFGWNAQDFTAGIHQIIEQFYRDKPPVNVNVPRVLKRWEKTWIEEIACDMIATYLTGPAYGWTNMKICMESSPKMLFGDPEARSEHPAHEARMRAICKMLELTGHIAELAELSDAWKEFMEDSRPPFANYYQTHPQEFIDAIAANVLKVCQEITLRPYKEQLGLAQPPVSKTLNEAWVILREKPEAFMEWEIEKIRQLGFEG